MVASCRSYNSLTRLEVGPHLAMRPASVTVRSTESCAWASSSDTAAQPSLFLGRAWLTHNSNSTPSQPVAPLI